MERRAFLGLVGSGDCSAGQRGCVGAGGRWRTPERDGDETRLLETGYAVPETGKRYAAMLRQKLAAGGYAALTDPEALGRQLTIDLNAVSPDRHLRVTSDGVIRPGPGGPQPGPRIGPAPRRSVEDAGRVAKGVAYIRFVGFTGEPDAVAATAEFMKAHATAKALIVDCRYMAAAGWKR